MNGEVQNIVIQKEKKWGGKGKDPSKKRSRSDPVRGSLRHFQSTSPVHSDFFQLGDVLTGFALSGPFSELNGRTFQKYTNHGHAVLFPIHTPDEWKEMKKNIKADQMTANAKNRHKQMRSKNPELPLFELTPMKVSDAIEQTGRATY